MTALSDRIFQAYSRNVRDEEVYQYADVSGIQVIRKYKNPELSEKRQFIKFYLDTDGSICLGVDMVIRNKSDTWTIQDSSKFKKISNYLSYGEKEFSFNEDKLLLSYKNKQYNVTDLIDFLEKNHHSDMFRLSRLRNRGISILLSLIFFYVDRKYERMKYLFSNSRGVTSTNVEINFSRPKPDPLFKFFHLFKNPFAFTLGFSLPITWQLSVQLDPTYFTVQNPFFVFLTLSIFLVLEGIGDFLLKNINDKNGFIVKLAERSARIEGTLR
ncbi:MAG: hypothetical protein RL538_790 [Candidatus Parcubacteria bacterium]|jgi:hypothetical protein